jgi:RNA polymerase sigma factor (sigma-70 family)
VAFLLAFLLAIPMRCCPSGDLTKKEGDGTFRGSPTLTMAVEDQVRAAQRGDIVAINALLTELTPWVGRLCTSIALDRGADAMQETFIIVLRNLVTLREPAAFRGWVRRIAVREALRMVNAQRDLVVDEVPEGPETFAIVDLASAMDVRSLLADLPPLQRAVLVLRDLEDLSEDEAAAVLGVEVGTVKSRLHRARAAFREGWQP